MFPRAMCFLIYDFHKHASYYLENAFVLGARAAQLVEQGAENTTGCIHAGSTHTAMCAIPALDQDSSKNKSLNTTNTC